MLRNSLVENLKPKNIVKCSIGKLSYDLDNLKGGRTVLPIEMDLDKSGVLRQIFIT